MQLRTTFLILAQVGVTAACIAYEAYHIHSIYEDQGPIAALTALGIDLALVYTGGVVLEAATPALRAAVIAAPDKMPGMRIALGALAERLILATESLSGTKLGQGIAKVEAGLVKGYDKAKGVFGKGIPSGAPQAKNQVRFADEVTTELVPGLSFQGGRYAEGMAHISEPLADAPKLLRGSQNNAGNVPKEVASMLEGRTFRTFDEFRGEFWKTVANSKYAGEFNSYSVGRMKLGLAPEAPTSQWIGIGATVGKRGTVYELHHKTPIHAGGSTYDLSNITILTPRAHQEILEKAAHFGK